MSVGVYQDQEMARSTGFGDVIRQAIKADGRSLYRLALDSGVDVAVWQRFVSEERDVRLATAERMARALGLELRPALKKGLGKP